MSFTRLSSEQALNMKISVDNIFIVVYLPYAPDNYVKVYLYGLSLASHNIDADNDLDRIAKRLSLDPNIVMEAYKYWESQGLVSIAQTFPPTIEYLSVKHSSEQYKKFNKDKYKPFNDQLHAMLPHRNILPNEYNEYYSIMEAMHIEVEAMLTIIAYCIRIKGEDITYPYILAVARNLAHEGYTTYDRVQERLSEFDLYSADLLAVLKALKLKRSADHEDKRLYIKWTKTLGFNLETIVQVAKKTMKGGMPRLDALLSKYYENHLFSISEIDEYNRNRDKLYDLCKKVNRIIGVYYEQLDFIIETYITKWLNFGFDDETLTTIADYCFRHNIRTLEGMSETVNKFYKQGLLSISSINQFINEALSIDDSIKALLEGAGVPRPVNSRDRDSYRTWTYTWKMPQNMLEYAATLSQGKANPISYMNAILAGWFDKGVNTLEAAKQNSNTAPIIESETNVTKKYSSEQLNALFDQLDADEI